MGTLTGASLSLPEHCPHKLPTSCRLTATGYCCACQDKRPHASAYSTYVDGIGMVNRGTRWQRYCWFCREFWNNRVAAITPPISPSETRIPDSPDQTQFLERWFEYHRGDASCEKPWRDCDPGHLPILNEQEQVVSTSGSGQRNLVGEAVSIDNTLDNLLEEAEQEESARATNSSIQHNGTSLNRGGRTRTQDENMTGAYTLALRDLEQKILETNALLEETSLQRQRMAEELERLDQELRTQQRQRTDALREQRRLLALCRSSRQREERDDRAAQRMARVFGTREEMEAQGADYISPLSSMFNRAYERYRVAEDVRREERAAMRNAALYQQFMEPIRQVNVVPFVPITPEASRTLDDGDRPPPQTDAEMTLKLDCKVCLQQRANTALLPCGHLLLCSHCADICVPTKDGHALRKTACPSCRAPVRRRVTIYTAS